MKSSKKTVQSLTPLIKDGLSRRDLLKGLAGLGAAAALSSCTPIPKASGGATNPSTKHTASKSQVPVGAATQSRLLAERAEDYLQQIFEVARGPGGLIIAYVCTV